MKGQKKRERKNTQAKIGVDEKIIRRKNTYTKKLTDKKKS